MEAMTQDDTFLNIYHEAAYRGMTVEDQAMWCSACHKMLPCRWAPSPDAGPHWRCSKCGEVVPGKPPAEETGGRP